MKHRLKNLREPVLYFSPYYLRYFIFYSFIKYIVAYPHTARVTSFPTLLSLNSLLPSVPLVLRYLFLSILWYLIKINYLKWIKLIVRVQYPPWIVWHQYLPSTYLQLETHINITYTPDSSYCSKSLFADVQQYFK